MSVLEDAVSGLRSILSRLDDIDLWPPWDAVQQVVDRVYEAYQLITGDFKPEIDDIEAAGAAWRRIATRVAAGRTDLDRLPTAIGPTAWSGSDGDAFRRSVHALSPRLATVDAAALEVHGVLTTLATDMQAAADRRRRAADDLAEDLSISWSDLLPWEAVDFLRSRVEAVIRAIQEAIGAYEDAVAAVALARREVVTAMDGIRLPDALPGAGNPIDAVNAWDDDRGPLRGSTLARFNENFEELSPAEQRELRRALDNARSPEEAGWIQAAVASGLSGEALDNYIKQLSTMSQSDIEGLDPTDFRGDLSGQPDNTTCGSSTLVMARMMNDPAYAMWMLTGYNPLTGEQDPGGDSPTDQERRFEEAALDMHDKTNGPWQNGQPQVPWPQMWGTTPGAVLNEMNHGSSGVPGASYDMQYVDPGNRGEMFDRIAAASENGHAVPVFIGDQTRPGHAVLVTASSGDTVTIYDPYADSDGQGGGKAASVTVSREDWESGNVDVAGWDEPWAAAVPTD